MAIRIKFQVFVGRERVLREGYITYEEDQISVYKKPHFSEQVMTDGVSSVQLNV